MKNLAPSEIPVVSLNTTPREFRKNKKSTIAIIGAGSWGTAMAIHLANTGEQVMLWAKDPQHVIKMQQSRMNDRYLPNIKFPKTLTPTNDLEACQTLATHLILAVPSHAFSSVLTQLNPPLKGLAWLTKGLDPLTNQFLSQLVRDKWGNNFPLAVISGPSFAREVAKGQPTAIVIAGEQETYLKDLQYLFHHDTMRVYLSNDMVGVQLCGAIKNVLAIACGISDGLNFGANAKAALLTRGLAEMCRLGLSLDANPETFMGLAGVGDLVLTCTDDQSRNRRFGLLLGQGMSLSDAQEKIGQVVEGRHNAAQVCALAAEHHIDMPICTEVNALLEGRRSPKEAVTRLMQRPPREE
jgi:glycerol-3-phosphate dehydrogenase (NAD(P)+)